MKTNNYKKELELIEQKKKKSVEKLQKKQNKYLQGTKLCWKTKRQKNLSFLLYINLAQ